MEEAMPKNTAAAKNRSVEIPPKEGSLADASEQSKDDGLSRRAGVQMFVFLSVAVAALFPILLWSSRHDALLAVWRLSLLLCSYFYSAACALSADSAGTKVLHFFIVFFVVLSAFVVDLLNQIAGMMVIYFISVVMAGVFGHALAEHRESDGAEKAAFAAAAKTLSLANVMVARAPTSSRRVMFFVFAAAFVPGCAGGAKWLAECDPHGCTVAEFGPGMFLFMVISFSLLFGIFLELEPLYVRILGIECVTVFGGGFLAIIALRGISFLLNFGEVGETVALWIFLLGLAAFFGYCVRVHDSYVKIIRNPAVAALVKEINAARFENRKDGIDLGLNYAPTFF